MPEMYAKNGQFRIVDAKGKELMYPILIPEDYEICIEGEMLEELEYGELKIKGLSKPRVEIRRGQLFREVAEP